MPTGWDKTSTVAQLVAAIAVIVAIPVSLFQLQGIRDEIDAIEKQSAMDVLLRLEDRMNSETMQAAFGIFRLNKEKITADRLTQDDDLGKSLRVIGNLYESLALCVNKGYLSYDDASRILGADLVLFYNEVSSALS